MHVFGLYEKDKNKKTDRLLSHEKEFQK